MVLGAILMTLDLEIVGVDGKWIGLFFLLMGGTTFFHDVLHYAKFYTSMREMLQS